MARWRLFIAAPLPADTAAQLWQALAAVRDLHPEARWTEVESYHVTLVFLGSTDAGEVERLATTMALAAGGRPPFLAGVAGTGGRAGGRRGGVAWLSVGAGRRELSSLSLALDSTLASGVYGPMAPRPHVTVARRVEKPLLDDLAVHAGGLRLDWPVERVVLMRSHTGPRGSRYEELADVRLGGAGADS